MQTTKFITYSNNCPYYNIALEEALFLSVIESRIPTIRIWQNIQPCIYLGIGKKHKQEVYFEKCKIDNIPIIRRFSGGGTVFQDKGCLNFTFILPLEKYPKYKIIKNSYLEIFNIIKTTLFPFVSNISFNGTSDFCINNRKFSGNAQARRKNTLLHHGTILIDSNINMINKYLKQPLNIPKYRIDRKHNDFIINLKQENTKITIEKVLQEFKTFQSKFFNKSYIKDTLNSNQKLETKEINLANKLLLEKYKNNKWNYKI
jgi:lipoate---protein ligase